MRVQVRPVYKDWDIYVVFLVFQSVYYGHLSIRGWPLNPAVHVGKRQRSICTVIDWTLVCNVID